MDYDIKLPESPFVNIFNALDTSWLLYVWWGFVLISLLFFLVILYHWFRYEIKTTVAFGIVFVNAVVILGLMGGAFVNLTNFIS